MVNKEVFTIIWARLLEAKCFPAAMHLSTEIMWRHKLSSFWNHFEDDDRCYQERSVHARLRSTWFDLRQSRTGEPATPAARSTKQPPKFPSRARAASSPWEAASAAAKSSAPVTDVLANSSSASEDEGLDREAFAANTMVDLAHPPASSSSAEGSPNEFLLRKPSASPTRSLRGFDQQLTSKDGFIQAIKVSAHLSNEERQDAEFRLRTNQLVLTGENSLQCKLCTKSGPIYATCQDTERKTVDYGKSIALLSFCVF